MPITIYPADDDCTLVSPTKILKAPRDDLQTLFDILPSNKTWQFNSNCYLTEGDRIIQIAISHNRADIDLHPLVLQNLGFVLP